MNYTWIIVVAIGFLLAHLIAQFIGTKRKIGYGKSVFWSVLLSPVIGLIITMLSKPVDKE